MAAVPLRRDSSWVNAWRTLGRVLSFRLRREDVDAFDWRCLVFGLLWVWGVGMGRHWDATDATWVQYLGLGSLVYTVFLAGFLWLLAMPVVRRPISYFQTLTFVAMTAPPAMLYAIPVDWWVDAPTTVALSGWTLLFVAVYRVAMLGVFFIRAGGLPLLPAGVLTLAPITLIMVGLALSRFSTVIARGMAGIDAPPPTPEEVVVERFDNIIINLGTVALYAAPLVAIAYVLAMRTSPREPASAQQED